MSDKEDFKNWASESYDVCQAVEKSHARDGWNARQPEIDALKDKLESQEAQMEAVGSIERELRNELARIQAENAALAAAPALPAQPHHKLDDADIKAIALDCGFKFRLQPDGTEDLNPYVYRFARKILSTIPRAEDIDALRQRLTPPAQDDEPVAYMDVHDNWDLYKNKPEQIDVIPLYTRPDNSELRQAADVCHKLDTPSQVFFYEQDFYVLSNFSAFALVWRGIRFDTSEAAYHYEKFPDHGHIRWSIRNALSAHAAFKIAEHHKEYRRRDWDEVKVDIMRDILRTKVEQHEYVRRKLLATGDRELIEDSWRDDFWGWGPNRDGKNMLGKLWMEIRENLRVALEGK